MDFMIGIEQELLFFMNPSVIEKNKVFFDGFFKYPYYILIFWLLAKKEIIFFISYTLKYYNYPQLFSNLNNKFSLIKHK